jgi:hypothetical protein
MLCQQRLDSYVDIHASGTQGRLHSMQIQLAVAEARKRALSETSRSWAGGDLSFTQQRRRDDILSRSFEATSRHSSPERHSHPRRAVDASSPSRSRPATSSPGVLRVSDRYLGRSPYQQDSDDDEQNDNVDDEASPHVTGVSKTGACRRHAVSPIKKRVSIRNESRRSQDDDDDEQRQPPSWSDGPARRQDRGVAGRRRWPRAAGFEPRIEVESPLPPECRPNPYLEQLGLTTEQVAMLKLGGSPWAQHSDQSSSRTNPRAANG